MQITSPSFGRWTAHVTDYFTGADQKILERLVKMTFLGEIETAIRLGISFGLVTWG